MVFLLKKENVPNYSIPDLQKVNYFKINILVVLPLKCQQKIRLLGTGIHQGLSLILNVAAEEYYCSSRSSFGFKVLLHAPNEFPKIEHYGMSVGKGYETFVSVLPDFSEAANNTKHIPIKTRQCLFEKENFLSYYR